MPETASILQDSMKQEAPDASASESMSHPLYSSSVNNLRKHAVESNPPENINRMVGLLNFVIYLLIIFHCTTTRNLLSKKYK